MGKRGPKPQFGTRKMVALSPELAARIEAYRQTHDLKSEAEAIRQLIELGLMADAGEDGPGE